MGEALPPRIRKARTLLIEALRLLDLHGTMRVRRRDDHQGLAYVFTITIPEDEAASARELRRESLRRR
ncbi:MAG: hypothetical protein KIS78_35530 [Labilithrix sp.]|nr:hypothetical protein [Labilithrix sp.]MCW5837759.1 hypothetical protein [Labilithrix sp.]